MELALLMLYCGSEDVFVSIEWYNECFMGDVCGIAFWLS